jgi:hypothetical protein
MATLVHHPGLSFPPGCNVLPLTLVKVLWALGKMGSLLPYGRRKRRSFQLSGEAMCFLS